jgi:ankyrin repeat protein/serine/threonine protein kinase
MSATRALHQAVMNNDVASTDSLLKSAQFVSENISQKDALGRTPLMIAVSNGNAPLVQQLVEKGAEVLDRDLAGTGVLTMACSHSNTGQNEIVKCLLEAGADVHERDAQGLSPLMRAAQIGAIEILQILLNAGSRTSDHDDSGKTPLHHAAKHGYSKSCHLLLSNHASVNAVDKENRSALSIAAMTGNYAAARCLLDNGAKIDWQDDEGKTALHYASENGFPDIVQLLLKHRAKRHLPDHGNHTAEQLAEENLRTAVVTVFNGGHVETPMVSPVSIAQPTSLLSLTPPILAPSPTSSASPASSVSTSLETLKEKKIEQDFAELNISAEFVEIGSITLFRNQVIGRGSFGSTVFHGKFQKTRPCAVKQMSKSYFSFADNEVQVLLKSDGHPNVIRYFAREEDEESIYLATEFCAASFRDVVERSRVPSMHELRSQILRLHPSEICRQVMSGVQYLHSLGIVIRNIKPENVLFSTRPGLPIRVVLSDFGVGKPIMETGPSNNDVCFPVASAENLQWQSPEIIASLRAARIAATSSPPPARQGRAKSPAGRRSRSPSITGTGVAESIEELCKREITTKLDIFSAGLTLYFFLSDGGHPFGLPRARRQNILENRTPKLDKLEGSIFALGEVEEVRSLIRRMIQYHPDDRPTATQVLSHVYFWSGFKKLEFLREAADRFKIELQDPPTFVLRKLEAKSRVIFSPYSDWFDGIDKQLWDQLSKNAKYDKESVRDLLKAIRNLKNHYTEQPEEIKRLLGPLSDAFLHYWTGKFPNLLMSVYSTVFRDTQLSTESGFRVFVESQ